MKAAAADRPLGDEARTPPTQKLSEVEVAHLKEQVYRDILARLRVEHERGG